MPEDTSNTSNKAGNVKSTQEGKFVLSGFSCIKQLYEFGPLVDALLGPTPNRSLAGTVTKSYCCDVPFQFDPS